MKPPLFNSKPSRWTLLTLFFAAVCGLTACFSRPVLKRQTFSFSTPAGIPAGVVDHTRVLRIRTLQIAPPFDGRSLIYRTGDFSFVRDPYAEFLEAPAKELDSPIRAYLRQYGGLTAVVEAGSALTPNLLLEMNVKQLYGDFRSSEHPMATIVLHCVCLEATNGAPGRPVLEREYSSRVPLNAADPAALMAGWNQGLMAIVADLWTDLCLPQFARREE